MSYSRLADPFNLCSFKYADGRLGGLPAAPKGEGMCLVHYRRVLAAEKPRDDDLSRELASPSGDFMRQFDIHHVLAKLFTALAAKRITPRRASSLAYIASLISQAQKSAKAEAFYHRGRRGHGDRDNASKSTVKSDCVTKAIGENLRFELRHRVLGRRDFRASCEKSLRK